MPLAVPDFSPVRVLVVDDDPIYRQILRKTLATISGVELVGAVPSLDMARHRLNSSSIDLVTIDVTLRDECGLELLPWIKAQHPRTVTALLTQGSTESATAIRLGASSLIQKPSGPGALGELTGALTRLVRRIKPAPPISAATPTAKPPLAPVHRIAAQTLPMPREVVAVGASTGGPPVLAQFLKALPSGFEVPVLITQHMAAEHIPPFAALLERESGRAVRLGRHGQVVEAGHVYLACDARHMLVQRERQGLVLLQSDGPEEHHCKPAVDPLFRSVASVCGAAAVGVVMTGMGHDGAIGAVAMHQAGAPIVVQDPATCVVWAMPRSVIDANAADAVVAASEIAPTVMRWTMGLSKARRGVQP